MKKFCRYNSLNYFEKSKKLFSKYIIDRNNLLFNNHIYNNCKIQMQIYEEYIDDINSYLILSFEDDKKINKLILSEDFSRKGNILIDENEGYKALEIYEKMLPKYEGKCNIKEAFILAKIVTINYKLGNKNFDIYYYNMGKRVEFILKKYNLQTEWYLEFNEIFSKIIPKIKEDDVFEFQIEKNIKTKYKDIFKNIDEIFKKGKREFIIFILENYPYKGYEKEKEKNIIDFSNMTEELLFYLRRKYCPVEYSFDKEDEDSQLNYCLIKYIYQLLNELYLT